MADVAMTPRALAEHNLSNGGELAQIVNHFFFAEAAKGDHIFGGKYKLDCIVQGAPPFVLDADSQLHTLLSHLYALLQEHYAALDTTSLKRFASESFETSQALTTPNTNSGRNTDWAAMLARRTGPSDPFQPIDVPLRQAHRSGFVQWAGSAPPRLCLDDHTLLAKAFWTLMQIPSAADGKTHDQLYGFAQAADIRPIRASGGSKRKSEDEHQLRTSRRQRREGETSGPLETVTEVGDAADKGDEHDEDTHDEMAKKAGLVAQNEGDMSEMSEVDSDGGDS